MHILYNCTAENKSVLGLFGLNVNRGKTDLFYSVCHCMCSSAAFETDNHQEQVRNKTDRSVQKKDQKSVFENLVDVRRHRPDCFKMTRRTQ